MKLSVIACLVTALIIAAPVSAKYKETTSRTKLADGEIEVTTPGKFDQAGKTYVLTKDLSVATTEIFLGNNVTLDLNGHTITLVDGKYEHVPNYSFEDGLKGWDVTGAPGAKVEDRHLLHPIDGKNVCILPAGQEIVSPYINLPVANRSYYGFAITASDKMPISVIVENEKGEPVVCDYKLGDKIRKCAPMLDAAPKIGGGGVVAYFWGQPAGKYRIRVKAGKNEAVIDSVDIRPAMDAGIAIVEKTRPYAYQAGLMDGEKPAFVDYTKGRFGVTPEAGIPVVSGAGTITIRNGVIKAGFEGAMNCAIQSTATKAKVVIENVKIVNAGINTNAVKAAFGLLKDCRFEIDTPFIINRHTNEMSVVMTSESDPSEIAGCEFIGGQGCLAFGGKNTLVHDNFFANAQTVTNHYSIGVGADGAKIYNNVIEPKNGSGVYLYRNRDCEVYGNTFKINAAPPNNEYSKSDYSTNAIRISDYNEKEGSPKGCVNNKVYKNKISITGKNFEGADKKYMPMAYGIFMSTGGGQNYVYDNEVAVEHESPDKASGETFAFYVGGADNGGEFYNNRVTCNTTPIWVASRYGSATNTIMYNNVIVPKDPKGFITARIGWYKSLTKNVGFYSNTVEGGVFTVQVEDSKKEATCDVGWTLTVKADPKAEIVVSDKDGKEVTKKAADDKGVAVIRLAQYRVEGEKKVDCGPYTVKIGDKTQTVEMTKDVELSVK
ncbi:MAG: hypothetical protein EHM48_02835 [Planctomycetaceae bacterium]|nr:MAG: hypothetical protein EHM48_02835 [Planctomycetaceae bacterium]